MDSNLGLRQMWAFIIAGTCLTLIVCDRLFAIGDRAFSRLPAQSPADPSSAWAENVYSTLSMSKIESVKPQIVQVSLSEKAVEQLRPFRQLAESSSLFLLVGLVSLSMFMLVIALMHILQQRSTVHTLLSRIPLSIFSILTGCCLTLFYVSHSTNAAWDEIYVFGSQADNFAQKLLPAVSTTSSAGYAESSADFLSTVGAGLIRRLFADLNVETALVLSNSVITAALILIISRKLLKWWEISSVRSTNALMILTLLSPPNLLSLSAANPVMVANLGFVFLAVLVLRALDTGKTTSLGIGAILLGLIRWEFGVYGLILICTLHARSRFRNERLTSSFLKVLLGVLFALLLIAAVRFGLYGYPIPSGVIAKSVGLDFGYVSSSFRYLRETSQVLGWPGLIASQLTIYWLVSRRRLPFVAIGASLLPLVLALLAGGDWFPIEWGRYVWPSVSAIAVLAFIAVEKSELRLKVFRGINPAVLVFAVMSVVVGAEGFAALVSDFVKPSTPGRTECLARVGLSLKEILPAGVGVASAEVNTVAYFAGQPLTDLVGLVDHRVASVPPSPMNIGDLLHRRSNPAVLYEDRPGAIYLYEGAHCANFRPTNLSNKESEWSEMLNSTITRFRVGDVRKLLLSYSPVTIQNSLGDVHHVLLRTDLISSTP